jgi:GH25 family lysozyme M1 (1,4-beta-N-acetylmuramidase)
MNEWLQFAPGWAKDYDLWVAFYGLQSFLRFYIPWGWDDWQVWQHSSRGSVPGIQGNVDLNLAKEDWFESIVNPEQPNTVEVSVPKDADVIVIKRV